MELALSDNVVARWLLEHLRWLEENCALPRTETLLIELEFARAESVDDPYAFKFGRQVYSLRGVDGSYTQSELSWDEDLLRDLSQLRRFGRDAVVQQRFGDRLSRFLRPTQWQVHEHAIISAGLRQQRVILTIRSSAAELYALPWELITLTASGQHLGELDNMLVRYEWPASVIKARPPVPEPRRARVLLAWSAAAGAVPEKAHRLSIQQACMTGRVPFNAKVDVVGNASLTSLRDALESAREKGPPITILHLLCHGASAGTTFGLALNSDDGGTVVVDGARLRQVLAPFADELRLIVLMACDGSNPGEFGNQLGSVAQNLHRVGFAAVVASRYPLSVDGSERFTKAFYDALIGRQLSLGRAIRRARGRLAEDASRSDWASLQYYAKATEQPEADEPGSDSALQRSRPLLLRYVLPAVGGTSILAAILTAGRLIPPLNKGTAPVSEVRPKPPVWESAPDLSPKVLPAGNLAQSPSPKKEPISVKPAVVKRISPIVKNAVESSEELSHTFNVEALAHCKQDGSFDTKIDINKGDQISFNATGEACINDDKEGKGCTGPNGNVADFEKFKYGALVGRVGEPGVGRLFTIGENNKLDADAPGRLYMFYWDKICPGNTGHFDVTVKVKRAVKARDRSRSKNCISATGFARIAVKKGQSILFKAFISPLCDPRGWSIGEKILKFSGPRGFKDAKSSLALSSEYPIGLLMFAYSEKTHMT